MKKMIFPVALAALLMPGLAAAQSAIDGTWKIDMNNTEYSKPMNFLLLNGMYDCKTCSPPYKVKADGTDQAVSGNPYFDTEAVQVVNPNEVKFTDKKNGKVVNTMTVVISPDGKTGSAEMTNSSNTNGGAPIKAKFEVTRVGKGPAGSHAISGSWQPAKEGNSMSDNGTMVTYKVSGDTITMTSPTGQSYTAKMDGTDAPMKGDPGTTSVSVKTIGKNTMVETDKRDGKVIAVFTMTAAGDGKTAQASFDDKLANLTQKFEMKKQ